MSTPTRLDWVTPEMLSRMEHSVELLEDAGFVPPLTAAGIRSRIREYRTEHHTEPEGRDQEPAPEAGGFPHGTDPRPEIGGLPYRGHLCTAFCTADPDCPSNRD